MRGPSIVNLHLGHLGTVKALPQIRANGLGAKQLLLMTLSRLQRE